MNTKLEQISLVGRYVKVECCGGVLYHGFLYTVDPEGGDIYLVKEPNASGASAVFVNGRAIVRICGGVALGLFNGLVLILVTEVDSEVPSEKPVPSELSELMNFSPGQDISPEEAKTKRLDIIRICEAHRVPVTEISTDEGEPCLVVLDSIRVLSPYGVADCYSTNVSALSKVRSLVAQASGP